MSQPSRFGSTMKSYIMPESQPIESLSSNASTSSGEGEPWETEPPLTAAQARLKSRELLVKERMRARLKEYSDQRPFYLFVTTWNVNGQLPPREADALDAWLRPPPDCPQPPHFYIIGFQELDLDKRAYVLETSLKEQEWRRAVTASLKRMGDYRLLRLVRLVGIMLLVYVLEPLAQHVSNVSAAFIGTGIMGWMGNKGGVGVRLDFHTSELCFVTAHFAAHTEEVERRNEDYRAVSSKMLFTHMDLQAQNAGDWIPKRIKEHDLVLWLGDFNYRIAALPHADVVAHIDQQRIVDLHEHDQLRQQMEQKRVFQGFREGAIHFRPTYKYDVGSDQWDSSEKSRIPSWCDRVLWQARDDACVQQRVYDSRPQLRISDHKPVVALFEVGVRVVERAREKRVLEDVLKIIDREENLLLPAATVQPFDFQLGDVTFLQLVKRSVTIHNTGQVPLVFAFTPPPARQSSRKVCKDWINIAPRTGKISPGETTDVELEIEVNRKTVQQLTTGADQIDDILVLKLQGGRDFFICVQGRYVPSCFGTSLQQLAQSDHPMRAVAPPTVELLISFDQESDAHSAATPPDHFPPPAGIPVEIWRMLVHLHVSATEIADLFLQPGLSHEMEQIRDHLDARLPLPLPGSGHSVAEALLLFLDVLPEPLVPFSQYHRCLSVGARWDSSRAVLQEFPLVHRETFKALMVLLRELHKHWQRHPNGNTGTLEVIADMILKPAPDGGKPPAPMVETGRATSNAPVQAKQAASRQKVAFLQQFLRNRMDDEPVLPRSLSVPIPPPPVPPADSFESWSIF
ncbi:inositol polyphosphate 5-phosphatase OCRL-like [Paramacrobiotus metropolitanus]|uniref:inositol polyphosphate 5-phosphatase OCRL-like n=1 Tax=Paramacrobiotus metropolitanus TaxID=2943436 RepID=UPI002445F09F|nr:inositol polyphosphate 5-phosphatase OCRL-like [Paramacrobiotus metropolitanus]